ncbi:hypothetical protein [Flavobacterium sp.]|uniref:hypothetical protein n=1 Tax=Flavobacterium sp. TaxID=239 RepID=UPI002FDA8BDD
MATYFETGHAKNVDNFHLLIQFVMGFGAAYNPHNPSLQVAQLQQLEVEARERLLHVVQTNTEYNGAVNRRYYLFKELRSLVTRGNNVLQTTGADAQTLQDAKYFVRKVHGRRAQMIQAPLDINTPAPNTISTSQQSYTQLVQHVIGFKAVLESVPDYVANVADLELAAWDVKIQNLSLSNTDVAVRYVAVSNARLSRNAKLYADEDGLVSVALEVKKYVKGIFGSKSPQYLQVSGIKFRKVRRA